ncbi:MAG: translation elongation factor Ts [Candidatus Cyclonatronum sp.]|uniref:translation elongation factor Ts n=1 Tax=Cyclonatronum sp. TaxID=3024185 RepID=UPI0025C06076|nr:translation elongation factor Ts [Cyclonatronum sp.]MCC5934556.1 elongation factor Ts [Balneolales bacterium]MCH8485484.1 translation elongation factor Ts [Cyclonatronum sp.]
MSISAADVKKLRDVTGAGMMDCKKALSEANGDMEAAIEYLRKKGQKVAEKRADRDAKQGLIAVHLSDDGKKAAAVELNCETDFVARNEEFIQNAEAFAKLAFDQNVATADAIRGLAFESGTVAGQLETLVGKIGEKIDISRVVLLQTEGQIVSYIHPGSQLAVLVDFEGPLKNAEVGKDVAMQVAAMSPIATRREEVDGSVLEKEREIAVEQLINEGKPEEIARKAAEGKIRRFYEERVLLEQKFVKDNSLSVAQYLKQEGEPAVKSFSRIQLGEH